MSTPNSDYLSLHEVAERTGIARPSLYNHIRRGHLKAHKVGYYTVVKPEDCDAFKRRLKPLEFRGRTVYVFQ